MSLQFYPMYTHIDKASTVCVRIAGGEKAKERRTGAHITVVLVKDVKIYFRNSLLLINNGYFRNHKSPWLSRHLYPTA